MGFDEVRETFGWNNCVLVDDGGAKLVLNGSAALLGQGSCRALPISDVGIDANLRAELVAPGGRSVQTITVDLTGRLVGLTFGVEMPIFCILKGAELDGLVGALTLENPGEGTLAL